MTQEQFEEYLTRLFPHLRKKYATNDTNDDLLQRTAIDLFKKHEKFIVTTDQQFITLFLQFYGTWQFYRRSTIAKALSYESFTSEFMGNTSKEFLYDTDSYNPWVTVRIQALEYLEEVLDPMLKQVMQWYYIEGYTIEEIAKGIRKSPYTVFMRLKQGVKEIQDSLT